MSESPKYLNPSEAARRLGVSAKALRLYERRGLVVPLRTGAGWRVYGPEQMARAAEIAALRGLGFRLAEIGAVLRAGPDGLEPALAGRQAALEAEARRLAEALEAVRALRAGLAARRTPVAAFDLPWPWGGERFELLELKPVIFLVGSLGSGKTRLAQRLAETLPGGRFVGLERDPEAAAARLDADAGLRSAVERLATDIDVPATGPVLALLVALADGEGPLVIDLVEQGLDAEVQARLGAWLRRRNVGRSLILMTRSAVVLDLTAAGPPQTVLFCAANHGPPRLLEATPGLSGYESIAGCLAPPEVRARVEGMIAWRPHAA
ncbi:MerR family transcriptional regulator [Caulobacter mirabilis]|uniref:MerR family transcriptional regulator n=1 Tax=Caulobacter mirabilis TaxID=69666 RepID=A0A2D2AXL1_9CAUL|nr:MerR family transcriptional regulator [Caulobacter mirabilis]ATQ42754.1 MerR family transcriptional regulator [Caulobacter mirabilis]